MKKPSLFETKLLGLTMELDLKIRDYKILCDKLEELKMQKLDPNAKEYQDLYVALLKNKKEIEDINKSIKELKNKK